MSWTHSPENPLPPGTAVRCDTRIGDAFPAGPGEIVRVADDRSHYEVRWGEQTLVVYFDEIVDVVA
jgi:hypothetical protein